MNTDAIKQIVENSNHIISWSLAVIGGSIATIVGTSYIRPRGKLIQLLYLMFIPGWCLLGLACKYGNSVADRVIMLYIEGNNGALSAKILYKINDDYQAQVDYFNWGLLVFGIWLCSYLIWWIFENFKNQKVL